MFLPPSAARLAGLLLLGLLTTAAAQEPPAHTPAAAPAPLAEAAQTAQTAGSAAPSASAPQPHEPPAASAPAATTADARLGTFKTVQGEVTLAQGGVRRAAVVGEGLLRGDRLSTGPDSAVALTLRDGTVLALGANSALDLAEFTFDTTTHEGNMLVRLARGSLRMITGLIARLQPEQVKVTTPTAVIGVRGTDFIVEARP
ncbi:MAG: FecR family protein [Comamonadaceae bacterium]|nr:FecR family protein [Comamonadaceae bacterium]